MTFEEVVREFFGDGYHDEIRKILCKEDIKELVTDEMIDAESNLIPTQGNMLSLLDHIEKNKLVLKGNTRRKAQCIARTYHAGLLAMFPIQSRVKNDKYKEWRKIDWYNKGKELTEKANKKYIMLLNELGALTL